MAREKPRKEWAGKTDDSRIPDTVWRRVRSRANNICQNCGVRTRPGGGDCDHIEPVWKSTPGNPLNREGNLQWLCKNCHSAKTAREAAERAKSYKTEVALARPKTPCRKWPPKTPKGKTGMTRTTYYDERGRLCVRWQKQSELNPED